MRPESCKSSGSSNIPVIAARSPAIHSRSTLPSPMRPRPPVVPHSPPTTHRRTFRPSRSSCGWEPNRQPNSRPAARGLAGNARFRQGRARTVWRARDPGACHRSGAAASRRIQVPTWRPSGDPFAIGQWQVATTDRDSQIVTDQLQSAHIDSACVAQRLTGRVPGGQMRQLCGWRVHAADRVDFTALVPRGGSHQGPVGFVCAGPWPGWVVRLDPARLYRCSLRGRYSGVTILLSRPR
jgi:hypothetical protein